MRRVLILRRVIVALNSRAIILLFIIFTVQDGVIPVKKIEALTKKTVNENYSEELQKGTISFKAINIDKPENKYFVTRYKLYTKSVVVSELSDRKENRWKNLDQIWKKIQMKSLMLTISEVKQTII